MLGRYEIEIEISIETEIETEIEIEIDTPECYASCSHLLRTLKAASKPLPPPYHFYIAWPNRPFNHGLAGGCSRLVESHGE